MNLKEFPWENYLYYDSKHILPIICHRKPLSVEKQILSAFFLQNVVEDGSISQYELKGEALLQELFTFVEDEFVTTDVYSEEDSSDAISLLQRIRLACGSESNVDPAHVEFLTSELHRALRMFMLQQQIQGKYKEFKDDYFTA